MVLIDTSSWIHFLRRDGDPETRGRVRGLLLAGDAAWCPVVRLELWNGARGNREKAILLEFGQSLVELAIGESVWDAAYALARAARSSGLTLPATDIVIAACARVHQARLEHSDSDFDRIARVSAEA